MHFSLGNFHLILYHIAIVTHVYIEIYFPWKMFTIPSFCRDSPCIIVAMLFRLSLGTQKLQICQHTINFHSLAVYGEVKMNFSIAMQKS
jgi:hypothetical protein